MPEIVDPPVHRVRYRLPALLVAFRTVSQNFEGSVRRMTGPLDPAMALRTGTWEA